MPKRQMIINYVPGEECRIAITEDGRLEEFYQERASAESHVGNIYKGRITNVEPSIQAAFVDFGLERNGFLHISDLHPKYFTGDAKEETEQVGLKTPRRDRPPIQRCLRRGQEILVQVLKEGIGTKGPTLTSYLSIPGRFLVMMPDMERLGVSRKVEDDDARREMRAILNELKPPEGFGFIIRTAGIGRTKLELKRDLAYLQRLWKTIDKRMSETRIGELFAESDLVIRTIRDVYSSDIDRVIIDDASAARRAQDFLSISNPRSGSNVMVYRDAMPIFHRYDIERQIETINARTVPLPSGGSLVIDSTEALVAIDVNSGKSRESRDAETTAWKTNVEAVEEICRQLRLRDLGGVVVLDLIDMRDLKHRRDIEGRMRDHLKRDRARTRFSMISQFGIIEMTRQRMRPSLKKSLYMDCRSCHGQGEVKSPESVVLDVMRRLAMVLHRSVVTRVELIVSPDVAFQLLNLRRSALVAIEQEYGKGVLVRVNGEHGLDYVSIVAFDARDGQIEAEIRESMAEPELEAIQAVPLEGDLDPLEEEAEAEQAPGEIALDPEEAPAIVGDEDPNFAPMSDDDSTSPGDDARDARSGGAVQPAHDGVDGQPREGGGRKRRRRRGRRGRGGRGNAGGQPGTPGAPGAHPSDSGDGGVTGEQSHEHAQPGSHEPDNVGHGEGISDENDPPQPTSHESVPLFERERDGTQGPPGQPGEGGGRRRRRRGRRGGRGRRRDGQPGQPDQPGQAGQAQMNGNAPEPSGDQGGDAYDPHDNVGNTNDGGGQALPQGPEVGPVGNEGDPQQGQGGRRRRRRRGRRGRGGGGGEGQNSGPDGGQTDPNPGGGGPNDGGSGPNEGGGGPSGPEPSGHEPSGNGPTNGGDSGAPPGGSAPSDGGSGGYRGYRSHRPRP
ncbi:MAG: Rne/Rng family ribonuclease [Planctomycetes bacterium]|nr:Rne/Rng family ribonuclease [Planctomycetota bacterium]